MQTVFSTNYQMISQMLYDPQDKRVGSLIVVYGTCIAYINLISECLKEYLLIYGRNLNVRINSKKSSNFICNEKNRKN
jgi:hypothetical protein